MKPRTLGRSGCGRAGAQTVFSAPSNFLHEKAVGWGDILTTVVSFFPLLVPSLLSFVSSYSLFPLLWHRRSGRVSWADIMSTEGLDSETRRHGATERRTCDGIIRLACWRLLVRLLLISGPWTYIKISLSLDCLQSR